MNWDQVNDKGLVLLGAGRMGGAMLEGWLAGGIAPDAVTIVTPRPDKWRNRGVRIGNPPASPAVIVLAVKPQKMDEALQGAQLTAGPETLVISVAAGLPLSRFEETFPDSPIIRAMPNTPSAIGQGITALIGNEKASTYLDIAEHLLAAVGETVRLDQESQMDAVTAVSGSGPAYVFHMIEAMAAAGEAEGLPPALALRLARKTVAGAGALAMQEGADPTALREAVTSPRGTTAAGLDVLMNDDDGLPGLMRRTIAAAADRSRALGR